MTSTLRETAVATLASRMRFAGVIAASIVAIAIWSRAAVPNQHSWLPVDQPSDVPVQGGRATVDLYMSSADSVNLLVSNLGHSSQLSAMRMIAGPLSETPFFRPTPLPVKNTRTTAFETVKQAQSV